MSSSDNSEKIIYSYELSNYGEIIHKSIFAEVNAIGIKMDKHNNLFAATKDGVLVLSPNAEKLALIETPEMATNVCFGGVNDSLLFITTPSTIYSLQLEYNQYRKFDYNPFKKREIESISILKTEKNNASINYPALMPN